MHAETAGDEAAGSLISFEFDKCRFQSAVRRFHGLFEIYAGTSILPH